MHFLQVIWDDDVVYEEIDEETIYPVTAYEVLEP